jgi:lipopolysaccharide/colanic/teichoic acid biosynthesis glycosyltransferase
VTAATSNLAVPCPPAGAPDEAPLVWGLRARGLHDHFWAAHGVRVVRRGAGRFEHTGAETYLLLEADELVLFDPRQATPYRRRPGAVRLRVTEPDGQGYRERVNADESGRLVSVSRTYTPAILRETDVLVTGDPMMASLWRRSASPGAARRAVRLAAGLHAHRAASCEGRIFDASDPREAGRCVLSLMRHGQDSDPLWDCVKAPQPGVWVHESATVAPGVRFVAPVWIGAGVTLNRGDLVVGPCILGDRVRVAPPAGVRRLSPRSGRASAAPLPGPAWRRFARRAFDIVFSLAALLVTAPLYPPIMLALWLEDGRPFFFAHIRQTLGGRSFACYKIRTMARDAASRQAAVAGRNVCDGPQFHIEDDPRLLRTGRLLRRLHLDELPQFVNVLRGQMSVIGPRPSPDEENQFCPAWREARLSVKPGITGLWQVDRTRAPNADFQEWIRHDLEYVERRTPGLDALIIYKTIEDVCRRAAGHLPGSGRQRAA